MSLLIALGPGTIVSGDGASSGSGAATAIGRTVWAVVGAASGVGAASAVGADAGTLASDNFNRADGTLGSNWTTLTGTADPLIQSNEVAAPSTNAAYYSAVTWPANQFARLTLDAITSIDDTGIGPAVRLSASADTGYFALGWSSGSAIYKIVAGVITRLATGGPASAGDVLQLSVTGNALTLKINGVTAATATDSSIASGSAGFYGNADFILIITPTGDNWAAGDTGVRTATGSSAGVGAASAVGDAIWSSVASSAGVGSGSDVGAAVWAVAASSAGAGSAAGVGVEVRPAAGSIAGVATADGAGADGNAGASTTISATGEAAGTSTASAISDAPQQAVQQASGGAWKMPRAQREQPRRKNEKPRREAEKTAPVIVAARGKATGSSTVRARGEAIAYVAIRTGIASVDQRLELIDDVLPTVDAPITIAPPARASSEPTIVAGTAVANGNALGDARSAPVLRVVTDIRAADGAAHGWSEVRGVGERIAAREAPRVSETDIDEEELMLILAIAA